MVHILGKLGDCNLVDWIERILNQGRMSWHTFLDSKLRVGILYQRNIILKEYYIKGKLYKRNIILKKYSIFVIFYFMQCIGCDCNFQWDNLEPLRCNDWNHCNFYKTLFSLHSFYHLQMFMVPHWRTIQASGWVEASQRQLRISNVRSSGCLMPH